MTGLWGLSSHKLRPDQPGTCRNSAASGLCAKYSLEDANEWPGVETTPPTPSITASTGKWRCNPEMTCPRSTAQRPSQHWHHPPSSCRPRGPVCVAGPCHGVSVSLAPFIYTYVASSVLGSSWGLTTKGVSDNVPAERVLMGLPQVQVYLQSEVLGRERSCSQTQPGS